MAEKVDYSTVTVDFGDIMWKLHKVAEDMAKKAGDVEIDNTAFGEVGK